MQLQPAVPSGTVGKNSQIFPFFKKSQKILLLSTMSPDIKNIVLPKQNIYICTWRAEDGEGVRGIKHTYVSSRRGVLSGVQLSAVHRTGAQSVVTATMNLCGSEDNKCHDTYAFPLLNKCQMFIVIMMDNKSLAILALNHKIHAAPGCLAFARPLSSALALKNKPPGISPISLHFLSHELNSISQLQQKLKNNPEVLIEI